MWQVLRDWWPVTGELEVTAAAAEVSFYSFYCLVPSEKSLSACSLWSLGARRCWGKATPQCIPEKKKKEGDANLHGEFFLWVCSADSIKAVLINIRLGWFQENTSLNSCRKQELCVVMEKWLLPGQSLAATLTTALSFHSRSRIKTKQEKKERDKSN